MTDALTTPFGGLDRSTWAELAADHFYSSVPWLQLCDALRDEPMGALTGHLADGAPVAVPALLVRGPLRPLYDWRRLLDEASLAAPAPPPNGPRPPDILVGPPEGYQANLLGPPGADRESVAGVLVRRATDVAAEVTGGSVPACVAMYVSSADALAARRAGAPRPPVLLDTEAWIDVPEGGWEPWVAGLAPKRRSEVRREARRFADAGLEVTHRSLAEGYEDLVPLAVATDVKYGSTADPDRVRRYFDAFTARLGPVATVAVARRDGGPPAAFCVYVVHGDTAYLRWAGFDYERTAGAAAYFNVCYYAVIERSPGRGVRRLHAGIKASEAKALRGARLEPLWLVDLTGAAVTGDEQAVRVHNTARARAVLDHPLTGRASGDPATWLAVR